MDNSDEISYNKSNANDNVNLADGEVVEKIDISQLQDVTVPGCTHQRTSVTPADDEFDAPIDEVHCLDCPLGWHIRRVTS